MARKEAWENTKKVLRTGTFQEKVDHILQYYKLHLIIFIFAGIILSDIIYAKITEKDYVLQGMFLNTNAQAHTMDALEESYLKVSTIDPATQDIYFDASVYHSPNGDAEEVLTNYEEFQLLSVRVATGELDFVVGDYETMNYLAYKDYFEEIPNVLAKEQYEKYESCFLYYDRAFIHELEAIGNNSETIPLVVYPDPTKPNLMKEPVPIMIDISNCAKLKELYSNHEDQYALCIVVNSMNINEIVEFLNYVLE